MESQVTGNQNHRGGGSFYVPLQKFKSIGMREGACFVKLKLKESKAIQLRVWTGPEDSRRLRLPDFKIIGT